MRRTCSAFRCPAADLLDSAVVRFADSTPAFRTGQAEAITRMRADLTGFAGLLVTGAPVAGTGLAAVVGDARAVARTLLDARCGRMRT